MKYLKLIGINGVIECYPLKDYKKPSGDLNEFVVSVSLNVWQMSPQPFLRMSSSLFIAMARRLRQGA